MSADSKIEWTDATWNPVRGCDAVSPGCLNCYAAGVAARFSGPGLAYEGTATRKPGQQAKWTGKIILAEDKLTVPLHWREPRRIFVNSMSDLFHEDVPDEYIDRVFAVMASAPQHTFQILTKRADRMAKFLAESTREGGRWDHLLYDGDFPFPDTDAADVGYDRITDEPVLSNVWLGVSVEDQQRADERIPHLLATPATVRFLSCEPLLGPVDVSPWLRRVTSFHLAMNVEGALGNKSFDGFTDRESGRSLSRDEAKAELEMLLARGVKFIVMGDCDSFDAQSGCRGHKKPGIDWVIGGGESGHGARPMHPDWARSLRDQCQAAGVPFFFKQWGEWATAPWKVDRIDGESDEDFKARAEGIGATHALSLGGHLHEPTHKAWSCYRVNGGEGQHAAIRRVGKKAAGRLLDGRAWDEFPRVAEKSA